MNPLDLRAIKVLRRCGFHSKPLARHTGLYHATVRKLMAEDRRQYRAETMVGIHRALIGLRDTLNAVYKGVAPLPLDIHHPFKGL